MDYGTGAIMAVPGHDERDFAFAKKYGLAVVEVIASPGRVQGRDGQADRRPTPATACWCNSGQFDGLPKAEGIVKVTEWLKRPGQGRLRRQLQAARLAGLAPALLGRAHPHRLLRAGAARCRCPKTSCPCCCPTSPTTRPRASRRWRPPSTWINTDLPQVRRAGPARERHHGHLRGLVLVLPALHLARARRRGLRPRRPWTTGCRWTSTSVGWSTPSCT